jgi:copper chaperone NosL
MKKRLSTMHKILPLLLFVFLAGCEKNQTGPVEVKWDRDACERCRMVLSDRLHAAQIRGGPKDKKSKVYKFDDIGGAILWIGFKDWKDDARTEIWVNDHRDGKWIDARTAWYMKGHITPMEFGLGAQQEKIEQAMNYQQAIVYINERESRFNKSGSDLKEQMHEHNH